MAYPTTDPLPYPTLRKEYTDKNNPIFMSDIVVLNKQLFSLLRVFLGLPSSGASAFAILEGMDYTPGSPGSYNSGLVYMNGNFYKFSGTLTENKYLKPNLTDSTSKKFPDNNLYPTYTDYYCITSDTQVDNMPQFVGNMDQYRFNMTAMKGTTEGKVPVIGSAYLPSYVVVTGADKELNSAPQGLGSGAFTFNESALTTGQTVKVGSTGLISGFSFTDRGDPASVDFDSTTLNTSNVWTTLDLSSIITTPANIVLLKVSAFYGRVSFRKYGNSNTINISSVNQGLGGTSGIDTNYGDILVALSTDKKIQVSGQHYSGSGELYMTVGGWF